MRRIKDVLRLHHELGRGQREIARCLQIAQSTVNGYLSRAKRAGLSWPLPESLDDDRKLETALFRSTQIAPPSRPSLPDFIQVEKELRSHRHLTLLLLWQEYHEAHADGYSYSRFCVLYRRWKRKQDVVLRQDHKAGERLYVDWAGDELPIHDRDTGSVWHASVFGGLPGRQFLHVCGSDRGSTAGELDRGSCTNLRVYARLFAVYRPR